MHPTRPRILCVDDDPLTLQALTLGFEAYDFEVVTAPNGVVALLQFEAYHGNFTAILTDHTMPEMNGSMLVKQVRALNYQQRVMVMSVGLSLADFRCYHDCGVNGFLQKPFEISMLATLLRNSE